MAQACGRSKTLFIVSQIPHPSIHVIFLPQPSEQLRLQDGDSRWSFSLLQSQMCQNFSTRTLVLILPLNLVGCPSLTLQIDKIQMSKQKMSTYISILQPSDSTQALPMCAHNNIHGKRMQLINTWHRSRACLEYFYNRNST